MLLAAILFLARCAGLLYWKKGLESAMMAHTMAHIIMFDSNLDHESVAFSIMVP
jgi:hypothetical protein